MPKVNQPQSDRDAIQDQLDGMDAASPEESLALSSRNNVVLSLLGDEGYQQYALRLPFYTYPHNDLNKALEEATKEYPEIPQDVLESDLKGEIESHKNIQKRIEDHSTELLQRALPALQKLIEDKQKIGHKEIGYYEPAERTELGDWVRFYEEGEIPAQYGELGKYPIFADEIHVHRQSNANHGRDEYYVGDTLVVQSYYKNADDQSGWYSPWDKEPEYTLPFMNESHEPSGNAFQDRVSKSDFEKFVAALMEYKQKEEAA